MSKKASILIIFLFTVGFFTYILTFSKSNTSLVSPGISRGQLSLNLWFPKVKEFLATPDAPKISAKSAYFVDLDSGRVLYQKDPHQKLPVASLAKIMTAVVALENKHWDDIVVVSNHAASMEPDHMELIAGEKLTLEELLDGIFLVSANDAAEALAEASVGSRDEFISLMNNKAKQLGMNDTLYINPSGLEEDGKQQYSTAFDLALISRYAIKNFPHLVDISQNPHIFLPETSIHQSYDLYSGINLLTTYPGVIGFKTGFTPEAGLTLVTLAQRDGYEILGVLLNSENRREEARELLDYSFKKLGVSI